VDGFGFGRSHTVFLALWLLPSFLFAALVHVADAGHVLAMLPVVCLIGGRLLNRAASRLEPWLGRENALLMLLLPSLALNGLVFLGRFSLPQDRPATRLQALWLEVHDAMDLSSLWQMRRMTAADGRAMDQVGRLVAGRPEAAVLIWKGGSASWRMVAYYFPKLPVIAIGPKMLQHGAALVAARFLGPGPGELLEGTGTSPLQILLPAGARLLWIIDPKGSTLSKLSQRFVLRTAGPVYYHDLPAQDGEADLGAYVLVWKSRESQTAGMHLGL
jgi:hypothetical protein